MFTVLPHKKFVSSLVSLIVLLLFAAQTSAAAEPLININLAGGDVLADKLIGIGPAKAKAIILYRELHGPFKTVDELINVKGIGPRTLEKIRSQLVVNLRDKMKKEHNAIASTASSGAQTQANIERKTQRAVQAVINVARQSGAASKPKP